MNTFDILPEDLQCRACMCKNIEYQKFHTIKDIEIGMKIYEIFKYLTPQLEIREFDGLPQFICVGCLFKLKNAFEFQQMCIESDKKYRQLGKLKKDAIADVDINSSRNGHAASMSMSSIEQILKTEPIQIKDEDINIDEINSTLETNEIFPEEPTTTLNLTEEKLADDFQDSDPLENDGEELYENETHICTECKKVFGTQRSLLKHIRLHTDENPYTCSKCGKGFKSTTSLSQHIQRHSEDRRFQCPHCPKKFVCRAGVTKHQSIHSNAKNHICEICGSAFKRSYSLRNHMKIHSGIRPFKCEQCPGTFLTKHNLERHMLTHTGEKPHKCQYCSRAYTQSNELVKHLRLHLGDKVYKCTQCKEAFKYHAELMKHKFKHPTETPKRSQTPQISQTEELDYTIVKEEPTFST